MIKKFNEFINEAKEYVKLDGPAKKYFMPITKDSIKDAYEYLSTRTTSFEMEDNNLTAEITSFGKCNVVINHESDENTDKIFVKFETDKNDKILTFAEVIKYKFVKGKYWDDCATEVQYSVKFNSEYVKKIDGNLSTLSSFKSKAMMVFLEIPNHGEYIDLDSFVDAYESKKYGEYIKVDVVKNTL